MLLSLVTCLAFSGAESASSQEDMEALRARIRDAATHQDLAAALLLIHDAASATDILTRYQHVLRGLYWQDKDISLYANIGRAGMLWALAEAERVRNAEPETSAALRAEAKGFAYDLGSFTWPGWDEPGIQITDDIRRMGYDAARANLRLARELEKPADKMADAWWLLSAHMLAAGEYKRSEEVFGNATASARDAGDPDRVALNSGYASLATLCDTEVPEYRTVFESHIAELRAKATDNATYFADQLETAARVFTPEG
jgi:hypothetical protein